MKLHHFHKWGKWERVSHGDLERFTRGEWVEVGHFVDQKRSCSKCGFEERSTQKAYAV